MRRRKKNRKRIFKKKSLYGIVFGIIILSITFIYSTQHSPSNQTISQTFQLKAAVVDHLSLTYPSQTFNQTATNILKQAGYTIDYYPSEELNVEFYRNLPTHGYGLIILRVHSAIAEGTTRSVLITSEPYSETKYVYEQLTGQIKIVAFLPYNEGDPLYFGVDYQFVKRSMNGKFDNTIIIMMGCYGLTCATMAEAFIEKGAKVYISWNYSVLASHTDQATIQLLQHLITEKQTIKQAVTETMKEVGPDPADGSTLQYYPETSVDNYIIPNITSNLILNDATISGYDPETSLRYVYYLDAEKNFGRSIRFRY